MLLKLCVLAVCLVGLTEAWRKEMEGNPTGRKSSVEECIFEYMALHIECRFNQNSLLHSCFRL